MTRKNKFWILPSLAIGLLFLLATSCSKDDDDNSNKTVKDIDGNVYHTVTIGTQVWMVENLKTTKYRNGDPIPNITDREEWADLSTDAYCDYENKPSNSAIYGKLYNWYAVDDSRNIAPTGWHVPTDEEWTTLENYVAANLGASGSVAKALSSTTNWASSTKGGAVGNDLTKNNSSSFSALPSGYREYDLGFFSGIGDYGFWWSSTENFKYTAYFRYMDFEDSSLGSSDQVYRKWNGLKYNGYSIRCLRDN